MSKNLLRCLTLVATGVVAINIILSGCKGNSKEQERLNEEAESLVYAAYLDKDYPRIIKLMASHTSESTRTIIEALKADTDLFHNGAEQNDDLTMLAFRVEKKSI